MESGMKGWLYELRLQKKAQMGSMGSTKSSPMKNIWAQKGPMKIFGTHWGFGIFSSVKSQMG